jgi:hydrogenase maturation protease
MTGSVLVLGIGSPFHEDQAGIRLVERLRKERFSSGGPGVTLVFQTLDRPGWGLLEILKDADRAIIVDAMRSGQKPGTLSRLGLRDLPPDERLLTSHDVDVQTALALGQVLGLLPGRLVIFGIEIGPVPPFPSLRKIPPSERTVRALKEAIRRELSDECREDP